MRKSLFYVIAALTVCACRPDVTPDKETTCADALRTYVERYPAAEAQDLYKLVLQDLYGPGHLLTDSADCAYYIDAELASMPDTNEMPLYESTLCEGNYVRVNMLLIKHGVLDTETLTSAVMRSAQDIRPLDSRFVLSHSTAFKEAYHPHYRIVRRDIFEKELLPLINKSI